MTNIEKVIKKTKQYDVITFDVFDTLIIRDVKKPTSIFRLSYGSIGRYIRILAEMIARKSSKSGEVTLKDIQKYCPFNLDKEIEFEYEYCRRNPLIFELYKKLLNKGKKIYAISDMYLDSKTIHNILNKCGYNIPVIVSCEHSKSKKNGELFRLFLEENRYNPDDIMHIGDNHISDFEGAKKNGIESILIDKHDNKLAYTKYNKSNEEFAAFLNHGINDLSDPVEQIGYEIVGPIILSFCQWIHEKYLEEKFDCLFFLARDMQFTFDIYKEIYKEDKAKYLFVSRKSFLFSREHPEEMLKYLKIEGMFGSVAVVDVGWLGNAQVELEKYSKIIDEKSDIGGLYLGLKLFSKYIKRSSKSYSYVFRHFGEKIQCELIAPFLESLIGSNDRQVIAYKDGFPVFDREESRDKTNNIKSGARKFINDWLVYKNNKKINCKYVRRAFIKMFRYPKNEHISLLGNLHYEDFKDTCIVTYEEKFSYRKNIKKWLSDLSYSGWKGAFFKKSFKIYKPFLWLYLFLNTLRNMSIDMNKINKGKL